MIKLITIFIITSYSLMYCQTDSLNMLLNYYPLNTDNYFEYLSLSWEDPFPADTNSYSIKVIGDTTMENNLIYKNLLISSIPAGRYSYHIFERIDTVTGSVYRFDKYEVNEYMIDSLFAQPGDTIQCSREGISSFEYFETIFISETIDTIFNMPVSIREYFDQSFIPGETYYLAQNFGLYRRSSCEFSCGSTRLVYAVINGNEYGSPITSVNNNYNPIPGKYSLLQNYPNPFNPETTIEFELPELTSVEINIFDIRGKKMQTLINDKYGAGRYSISFSASHLSNGIYFCKLLSPSWSKVIKMILVK